MIDNYKDLDSHKLDFHLEEVLAWKRGETVFPIHLDVGPSGGCVYQCVHCYLKWYGHKPRFLSEEVMDNIIEDGVAHNLKSIFLAGSGEPLLNPYTPQFIVKAKEAGIDMAMATNGLLMKESVSEKVIPYLNWIRFNVLAYSKDTFSELHGTPPESRDKVFRNIRAFVRGRNRTGAHVGTGIGTCILPQATGELEDLIRFAKDAGVDYISLRPVSLNERNEFRVSNSALYHELSDRFADWEARYSDNGFRVLIRRNLFLDSCQAEKEYGQCYGIHFISQIDADGGIYACGCFVGDARYRFGNLNDQSYKEIMASPKRADVLNYVMPIPDPEYCDTSCRCHNINKYLWRHRHPPRDVNFI
ncbi:MAG: radical SAM protein [Deltaproteobacteria bacterium]|nr:radical SAM protein [Deltaproteobacteria bacterium]